MATLSSDQLSDFRSDIADPNAAAFDDTELQRLYARTSGNYEEAVKLAFMQLLADASKFTNYTQNQSREEKGAIRQNLKDMAALWGVEASGTRTQAKIYSMGAVPPLTKDKPSR